MQIITRAEAKAQGLKRYFTAKPCKFYHFALRQTGCGGCLVCKRNQTDKWQAKNKDRLLAYDKQRYHENADFHKARAKKYRDENKDWMTSYNKKYFKTDAGKQARKKYLKNNRHKTRAKDAKRNAAKKNAIPKLANLDKVKEIYESCPKGFHVDHIVPLVSKFVCGLHCEANLQHLPALENISKNNRWWPDMWE